MKKLYACLAAAFLFSSHLFSQAVYRSDVPSGNWNSNLSWFLVSGTDSDADGVPDADDDVYIQTGTTITLTATQACKDLHISTGTTSATAGSEGAIVLGGNTLNINGKLRCYFSNLGTTPGTSSNLGYAVYPFSGAGTVRVVGNSRPITVAGEWGATITNPTSGSFPLIVDMNPGQILTLATSFKSTSLTVTTGTFDLSNFTYGLDNGTTGQGDVTIGAGAAVTSSASSQNIFQRTGTTPAGTLTINPNGKLILTGAIPKIQMTNYALSGTVEYGGAAQTWADKGTDATTPGNTPLIYTNVILSNAGIKTSVANSAVQVLGTLSLQGTSTFSLGTASTLQYAAGATLEYAGSIAQTATNAEFPGPFGPTNLTINNASGVNLHASRTVNALTLTTGNLKLGNNSVIVSNIIGGAASSYIVTDGTGKLTYSNVSTAKLFPIGTVNTYNPLSIGNGTNVGNINYSVKVDEGFTAAAIADPTIAVNRTWIVRPSSTPAGSILVDFYYTGTPATDANASFSVAPATVDLGILIPVYGWNVTQPGITQVPSGSMYVANTTVFSFLAANDFAMVIGNLGAVLATSSSTVNLTVQKQNNKALLNWKLNTATMFIKEVLVEHSTNGYNFEKLATVPSLITVYTDDKLAAGKNFYRLKVTDANGKISYSTVAVIINSDSGFEIVNLLPGLVTNSLQVNMAAAKKSTIILVITDAAGRPVTKAVYGLVAGSNLLDVNVSKLAAGMYYLTASAAEGVVRTVRFVKQ